MKKLLLGILLAGLSLPLFAQQKVHKTYSGDYLLSDAGIMGKATYSYYEDEKGNYVKDGKFTLTVDVRFVNKVGTTSSLKTVINGNYKDGLMNGAWSWNVSSVDYPDNADVCTTTTKKMTGSFVNGLPDGQWNYNSAPQKKRKILVKTYWPTTYKFGEYYTSNNVSGSCQISFKNGYATGVVSSNCLGSVKGQYKEPNCPIGKWNSTSINGIVTEATFQNGYLTSKLSRRDGRVLTRSEWPEAVISATKKVASGEIKEEDLDGFVVEEHSMSGIYDVDLLLNDVSFYRKDLKGDNTPTYGAIYGKYKQVLQIKYEDWNAILKYNNWLERGSYKNKVSFYEKYLNSIYIRKADKVEIKKLIEECNEEITKEPIKQELANGINDSIYLCQKILNERALISALPKTVSNESAKKVYTLFRDTIKQISEENEKKTNLLRRGGYSNSKVEDMYAHESNMQTCIECCTLEDIANVSNQKRNDIKSIIMQEEELNRLVVELNKFVDLESQNTQNRNNVFTDFGLASNTKTTGILPYLHIAFEHMLNNNCSLDEYIDIITAASHVEGTDKDLQKKFKPVKKSPSGIIEMIKSYNL